MNFLQLVNRLCVESGSDTTLSTVASQSGEAGRMVGWIASAWEDLQLSRPDWYWMQYEFTLPLVASVRSYSPTDAGVTTRFSSWNTDSLRIYRTDKSDETVLPFIPYSDFRSMYLTGQIIETQPIVFTVDPRLNLLMGPMPDGVYTVTGEYFKSVQTLALDADTPELPSQFHMAIVYRALMLYARYEAAGEIYNDAALNYTRFLRRIQLNQLPGMTVAEPIA
jgi:hypothetical protein